MGEGEGVMVKNSFTLSAPQPLSLVSHVFYISFQSLRFRQPVSVLKLRRGRLGKWLDVFSAYLIALMNLMLCLLPSEDVGTNLLFHCVGACSQQCAPMC